MKHVAVGAWMLPVMLQLAVLPLVPGAAETGPPALPNPFYAMDTSFRRAELKPGEQLDLVRELGFPGVAWTEQAPAQVKSSLQELQARSLKMYTIYCSATVSPEGRLTTSSNLPAILEALKGQGTILWLHIGGKGPAFASLKGDEPLVQALRELADKAAGHGLSLSVYPHVGEWTARFADAVTLAKVVNHKAFGVTFNLCHALAMGEEQQIPALLEQARAVLNTATICGADSGVTGGKWDRLIQPLGQGTYDVGLVLRTLKRIGFTGPVGFQGYGIKAGAREILTPTMAAWKKLGA